MQWCVELGLVLNTVPVPVTVPVTVPVPVPVTVTVTAVWSSARAPVGGHVEGLAAPVRRQHARAEGRQCGMLSQRQLDARGQGGMRAAEGQRLLR
eukprot:1189154-Prorocentrum_minimum.AAC.1